MVKDVIWRVAEFLDSLLVREDNCRVGSAMHASHGPLSTRSQVQYASCFISSQGCLKFYSFFTIIGLFDFLRLDIHGRCQSWQTRSTRPLCGLTIIKENKSMMRRPKTA